MLLLFFLLLEAKEDGQGDHGRDDGGDRRDRGRHAVHHTTRIRRAKQPQSSAAKKSSEQAPGKTTSK